MFEDPEGFLLSSSRTGVVSLWSLIVAKSAARLHKAAVENLKAVPWSSAGIIFGGLRWSCKGWSAFCMRGEAK